MNRIDRLFGILVLLQSRKYVSGEAIAEKFGISIRTVYRDVKALGEQGIPVSFEPARGYYIVQGYFLPPVSFTSDEANALLLTESLVRGFADRSIQQHYFTALSKVRAILPGQQKEKLERLAKNIRLQVPTRLNQDFDYLSELQSAISMHQTICLDYKNNKDEVSRRKVEPIGLIFYAFSWHLIGWCQLRSEYRDFKVSRITGLSITTEPFTKTKHMELGDYMKQLPVDY